MIIYIISGVLFFCYIVLVIFCVYTVYAIIWGAPFVPSALGTVKKMIEMADLHGNDMLMDLGSGDGRILKKAAPHVKYAVGIEINPLLYFWSKTRLAKYKNIKVQRTNLWKVDLKDVDVLTIFFIAHHMGALKQKIKKEMKPGSRVVSYGFSFPDWQYAKKDAKVYLYIV